MATSTPIRFRPTIVLCVGDRGREVGAQLSMLLPGLDGARQAGIALLTVDDDATMTARCSAPGTIRASAPSPAYPAPYPTIRPSALIAARYQPS